MPLLEKLWPRYGREQEGYMTVVCTYTTVYYASSGVELEPDEMSVSCIAVSIFLTRKL